jgi:hypothetical protein
VYRAMAWLGEPLSESQQSGATPFVSLGALNPATHGRVKTGSEQVV